MKDVMTQHVEKLLAKRYSAIEGMAKAFLEYTRLPVDRIELVENRDSDGRTTWFFREKKEDSKGWMGVSPSPKQMDNWLKLQDMRAKMGLPPLDHTLLGDHQVREELDGMIGSPWKCSKCQNIYGNLETTNREAIFAEDGTTQVGVRQTISHHCGPCGNVEKKTTNHCVYCNAEDGSRHQDDCKWLKGQLFNAAKKINEATNSVATDEMRDKAMREIVQSMPLVDEGRCPGCLAAEGDCEDVGHCGTMLNQKKANFTDDDTPMPTIVEKPK